MKWEVRKLNRPRVFFSEPSAVVKDVKQFVFVPETSYLSVPYLESMDIGQVSTFRYGFVDADIIRVE